MMRQLFLPFLLLMLSACAGSPLKLEGVNRAVTPAMATGDKTYGNLRVVWGGMIVRTTPQKEHTQIEVLAYPVDSYGEPDRQAASQGRFLIERQGYLEPADFAAGRWISAVGTIGQPQIGKVGEASYRFPVLVPEQLYLWPQSSSSKTQTYFHFGIGIRL
ncbi:MAG: hypothetical protein GC149_14040 [Gammaproteobacteria bacterium]|nr:hypothetical protein [Gammaproteobacteria bacterium]